MNRSNRTILAAAIVLVGCASALRVSAEPDGRRHAMGAIFDSVRVLLIANTSEANFADPARQAAIANALDELADQAAMLAEHAGAASDEEEFLASALERYAGWTRRAMERAEPGQARLMIRQVTELCIACHTRTPEARDSVRAGDFADSEALAGLNARERARLLVATRRFEPALERFEAALPRIDVSDPALVEDLTTYLIVSVRVREDYRRPLPLLSELRQRHGLDPALGDAVAYWVEDLQSFARASPPRGDVAALRHLVDRAEARGEAAPLGGVVTYAAASGAAQRLLDSQRLDASDLAEVYLLLGLCEHRLQPLGWIPLAELHLEQAVRAAPGTDLARRAYALLRDRLARTYGNAVSQMPPEVADHLARLRELAG